MKTFLVAVQALACVVLVLASVRLVYAGGDSCNQVVRRMTDPPQTQFMMTQCDSEEVCLEDKTCTPKDRHGYTICVCDTLGLQCEIGFDYDGGQIMVDGQPKFTGRGACIQWTCGLPCNSEWEDVPGADPHQEKLICECP